MHVVRFGNIEFPQEDQETGFPFTARLSMMEMPYGAFDQDGNGSVIRPRNLSLRFSVVDDEIEDVTDSLMSEVGRGRRILVAKTRAGQLRQTFAKVIDVQREQRPGMSGYQPMVFTLFQDYPYWLATDDEPRYLDNGEYLDAEWNFDAGHIEQESITASPHVFTVSNSGTAAVIRGLVGIEPQAAATITDIRITNLTNGQWWQWSGDLTEDDSVLVDWLSKSVLFNSSPGGYENVAISDDQVDWMTLELGDNEIEITGTGISGTISFTWQWSRHYL